MNKIKQIFLPNKGAHDYSPANCYGNFTTVTDGPLKLTEVGYITRMAQEALKNSQPEDYILLCGPTIANVIVTSIFVQKHGRINLLIFRSGSRGPRYIERTIMLDDYLNNPSTKEVFK